LEEFRNQFVFERDLFQFYHLPFNAYVVTVRAGRTALILINPFWITSKPKTGL